MTRSPSFNRGGADRLRFGNGRQDHPPEPGLFDAPDRAIAAMDALVSDAHDDRAYQIAQLSALLRATAGTRFWTEADMRRYAGLVNEMLDRLRVRLLAPDGEPCRLGLKSSNRPSGRYTLFRYQPPQGSGSICHRQLPEGMILCGPQ